MLSYPNSDAPGKVIYYNEPDPDVIRDGRQPLDLLPGEPPGVQRLRDVCDSEGLGAV